MQSFRPGLMLSLVATQAVVAVAAAGFLLGHFDSARAAGTTTCRPAAAADAAAVSQLLTSTVPRSERIRLDHPRTMLLGVTGMYFLGARIVDATGRSLGVGVWRIISARNTVGLPADVAAANPVAQTLTPDLGRLAYAGSAGPPACLVAP